MPYMCTIQMPMGKPKELIEKTMVDVSEVLIRNFEGKPKQVRVIVDEQTSAATRKKKAGKIFATPSTMDVSLSKLA